jgi:hypothetical protein
VNRKRISQILFVISVGLLIFIGREAFVFLDQVRMQQKNFVSQMTSTHVSAAPVVVANSISTTTTTQNSEASTPVTAEKPAAGNFREAVEFFSRQPLITVCRWADFLRDHPDETAALGVKTLNILLVVDSKILPSMMQIRLPENQDVLVDLDESPSLIRNIEYAVKLYRAKRELEEHIAEVEY